MKNSIQRVVRGERHWSSLLENGIEITHQGQKWVFGPVTTEPYQVQPRDIAHAVEKLAGKPDQLEEWASFVTSASSLVGLEEVEQASIGDQLIAILWDLSFGLLLSQETLDLIKHVEGNEGEGNQTQ